MHQNAFGSRALPGPAGARPTGGVYSTPPDPLAGLKWNGREEGAREMRKGKEGRGRFMGKGAMGNYFPEKCGKILNGRLL